MSRISSQQRMMEQVVAPLHHNDQRIFKSPDGEFLPIARWQGVTVNDKGDVIAVHWFHMFHESESLNIESMPSSVQDVSVYGNGPNMNSYGMEEIVSPMRGKIE
mmetsp:Transcript_7531/g.11341  ORF Transcript_7531/g.11341 Transcript_7531/m.11341 type:complete len:104 (-) Transcript_7531:18-329(-)